MQHGHVSSVSTRCWVCSCANVQCLAMMVMGAGGEDGCNTFHDGFCNYS